MAVGADRSGISVGAGYVPLGSLFPTGIGKAYDRGEPRIGFQPHFLGRRRYHRARRSGLRLFARVAEDGWVAMQAVEVKRLILTVSCVSRRLE
ncbi:MAG: hypothetical protein WDM87_17685 [Terracidiphilus sp.]